MKVFVLKNSILTLIVSVFLFAFISQPDRANFSGGWSLNEGKSNFGERGARFATKLIRVDQKDDAIIISRTTPSFQGGDDVTTSETLSFDGKESETSVFGTMTRKSSLKWADDGQSFVISSTTSGERNGQSFSINATETWALADAGKSLSVTTVRATQQGESTTTAVYDKQ